MSFPHRFTFLAALVLAPLAPFATACSGAAAPDAVEASPDASDTPSPSPAGSARPNDPRAPETDAGAGADASADHDSGKPSCNSLVNVAADVPIIAAPSAPPPATGGAIADGTYVVTRATVYTGIGGAAGPTGKSVKMTVTVAGANVESVFDGVTRSATIAMAGTMLESTTTCPGTGTDELPYSATSTSLTLVLIDTAGTRVYSLEKQ